MLIHEIERSGQWLFRYRSFVPLILLPFAVLALSTQHRYLGDSPLVEFLYQIGCFLVSLAGLIIRAIAQGQALPNSSGRNTKSQIADRLNTRGIYAVVRHPLYLGNMVMILGVLLLTRSPWIIPAGMLFYFIVYERIIAAEERFLADRFGASYHEWADRTPALWPRIRRWEKSTIPFSWRAAVKGEFYGLTATIATVALVDTLRNRFVTGQFRMSFVWAILLIAAIVFFFVLRFVRKHTRFFETPVTRD